jgi:hypothetical protein
MKDKARKDENRRRDGPRRGGLPLRGTRVHEDRRSRLSNEEAVKEVVEALAPAAEIDPLRNLDPKASKHIEQPTRTMETKGEKSGELRTAYDLKDVHRALTGFKDDDLKQIPILVPGTRLHQGATYIDLAESPPREFTARSHMVSGQDNSYVQKDRVPFELWNRLIGRPKPAP